MLQTKQRYYQLIYGFPVIHLLLAFCMCLFKLYDYELELIFV